MTTTVMKYFALKLSNISSLKGHNLFQDFFKKNLAIIFFLVLEVFFFALEWKKYDISLKF